MSARKVKSDRLDAAAAFRLGRLTNEYHFYLSQLLVLIGFDPRAYEDECATLKLKVRRCLDAIEAEAAGTSCFETLRNGLPSTRERLERLDNETGAIKTFVVGKNMAALHGVSRRLIDGMHESVSALEFALGLSVKDAICSDLVGRSDELGDTIIDLLPDGLIKETYRLDAAWRQSLILDRAIDDLCSLSARNCDSDVTNAWIIGLLIDEGVRWRNVTSFMFSGSSKFDVKKHEPVAAALRPGGGKRLRFTEYLLDNVSPQVVGEADIIPSDHWYVCTNIAIGKFDWRNRLSNQLSQADPASLRAVSTTAGDIQKWHKKLENIAKSIYRELRRPWKSDNEARDRWIYEQLKKGKKPTPVFHEYQGIWKSRVWEPINSVAGLTQAAKRHADRHGLPLPKGPRGRKKVKEPNSVQGVKRKKRHK